jgi:D-3-phosphoglycerate dehydrogenase
VKKHRIQLVKLPALLRLSDVISLHTTLNKTTAGMIGKRELQQMKPGAVLINTARGELLQEKPLAEALYKGRLGGAGLDVFVREPYKGPLLRCPNTVLTCHMGTYAEETRTLMEIQAAQNLIRALRSRSHASNASH